MLKLQNELVDRAINDALAGDIPAARSALSQVDKQSIPAVTPILIEALALINQGKPDEANDKIEAIGGEERKSRVVRAVEGLVMFQGQHLEKMERLFGSAPSPTESSDVATADLETLAAAQIESYNAAVNHEKLLDDIMAVITRHPRWGIAHAIRSQVLLGKAKRNANMDTLKQAHAAAKIAVGYSPDCPMTVLILLRVTSAMIELARQTPDMNVEIQSLEKEGEGLAKYLDLWPNFSLGRQWRLEFYRLTKNLDKLKSESEIVAQMSFVDQVQAAMALPDLDSGRILDLRNNNVYYGTQVGAIRKVLDGEAEAALNDFEALWKKNTNVLLRTISLEIPLLAQRPDIARVRAKEALRDGWAELFPQPEWSNVCVLKYFADEYDETELRRSFGPFQVEQSVLEWAIGLKKLSQAHSTEDVAEARKHLAEAANCVIVGWWHREFSRAYVKLIEQGRLPASSEVSK